VLDVAIVGAGQGGLGTAFGLLRERISNIQVFDRNHQGLEGPWVTFARMITLRTPKHITGPDYGVASLTPRAWYEAKYGVAAWAGLDKIARQDWQAYLRWFRRVTDIPVQNDADVAAIRPEGAALRLILATPTGSRRWEIPGFISRPIPPDRFAHTVQDIDFGRLAGRRIGVLGAGASAFDNGATALEVGAGSVGLCLCRRDLPRINPYSAHQSL
jgi:cation diffusion facilitator CzcD-associated flavoprotein CzcO